MIDGVRETPRICCRTLTISSNEEPEDASRICHLLLELVAGDIALFTIPQILIIMIELVSLSATSFASQ